MRTKLAEWPLKSADMTQAFWMSLAALNKPLQWVEWCGA
jgi:hypothetical protein